jgi:hypothetical protein
MQAEITKRITADLIGELALTGSRGVGLSEARNDPARSRSPSTKGALTGWFSAIATYNPVTYLLGALRSLITTGWNGEALLEGVAALVGIGCLSMSLAFIALRGRVRQRD